MSGIEAATVVGLISSIITLIEASRKVYDAATDARGLHEAFRAVAKNIPLTLAILEDCKRIQEQADHEYGVTSDPKVKLDINRASEAVQPVLSACHANAASLKGIFEKVVPGEYADRLERYRKAAKAVSPGKRRKVEDLMKDTLEKLQLLHTSQYFRGVAEKRSGELPAAIGQLNELESSLPDEEGRYAHYGSGSMNVQAGSGTQNNFTQSGGSGNK